MNVITNNPIKLTIALAALQQVVDPEIELNIVDLGLIYQLDFDDDKSSIFPTVCSLASINSAISLIPAFSPESNLEAR